MEVTYKNQGIFDSDKSSEFTLGPWTVENFNVSKGQIVSTGDCVGWNNHDTLDDDDIDSALQFARVMVFIVCVPAYFMTLGFAFGSCMVLGKFCIYALALSYFLSGILFPVSLVRINTRHVVVVAREFFS